MLIEISIIAAFAAMLCWGIGDFFIQRSVRKVGDIEALALIGIIGAIGLIPFVIKDFSLLFSLRNILSLVVLGVVTFIAAILNFEALKKGKLSVIEVIIEVELPVTIILGIIFFKEQLSLLQLGIIGLIFVGMIMMAARSSLLKNPLKSIEKGVAIGALAAVGMGFVNFLTATSSKQISPLMAVWFPWIIYTVICLFLIGRREGFGKFIKNTFRYKWIILGMGVFDTLAWLSYARAVINNPIAITTAITESYPAIGIFLGLWLNREKVEWYQYLGAAIAMGCCFVLAFVI